VLVLVLVLVYRRSLHPTLQSNATPCPARSAMPMDYCTMMQVAPIYSGTNGLRSTRCRRPDKPYPLHRAGIRHLAEEEEVVVAEVAQELGLA
jgi:hypothetical protein